MKKIPKKYMYKGTSSHGGTRSISPIGQELNALDLEVIDCPCCGKKELVLSSFSYSSDFPEYQVCCDSCDWSCPLSLSDCGEAIVLFKNWLEAYKLLGEPKDKLKEDLTLYFYPDDWFDEKE
jgi:transcription elongation factor Elf1